VAAGLVLGALAAPASGFEIPRTKTEAVIQTSTSGDEIVQLTFVAELVNEGGPDVSDDVVVTWQEVGGIEPTPFRILIPAGCFRDRRGRGFYVDDFRACGVELSVASSARGLALLEIVDFQARLLHRDDGASRFDIVTSVIPPDPVVPPDPIVPPSPGRAFLGIVGGAAVEIAIGSESSAAAPLRIETVSGVEPQPF
jgi:hypothetical protein